MKINKDFSTKKEEIEYVYKNRKEIIAIKKGALKMADSIDSQIQNSELVSKAMHTSNEEDTDTEIKRTIIGNTYFWMDSHNDVHVDNTFKKSISEKGGDVLHLHDHIFQLTAKVGTPSKVYESTIKWTDLGVEKSGTTTVVMMETTIKSSLNSKIFSQYLSKDINQHSVGMHYVKIDMAINGKEYKEEYATWLRYIDLLGNKEKADEKGYFWAVKEAKLVEISAVIKGSNELTPTIDTKDIEPSVDTQNEPLKDTQNDLEKGSKLSIYNFI